VTLWAALLWVAAARLGELALSRRNERRLRARGATEAGRGHYPLFLLLHAGWLAAIALLADPRRPPEWGWLALFAALQPARAWVLLSLGPYWTTRVLTLAEAPLARRGPYRWLRHPNYLIVALEIAALPLAFGLWRVALLFSACNLALLAHRIRIEDAALAPRRLRE
jgi:methyltransferase